MKRWLLIVGAGVYQVPLIRAAQRLGFRALVTSRPGRYPGIPLADRFAPLDTTDSPSHIALVREYGVAGVLTAGTDVAVPTVGAVVDSLRLYGPTYATAATCSNKVAMKHTLERAGVPTAPFIVTGTLDEAARAAEHIGYPVMIKAVDSSGSRGITRVDDTSRLAQAWQAATAVSHAREVLVERCLDGLEFGAQCVVVGSEPALTLPHNDTVTPPPVCVPVGHSLPALLPEACVAHVFDVVVRATAALGLTNTGVNFDFIWSGDTAYILEVGARIGATCLPELVSVHTGIDMYELLVRLAVGEQPAVSHNGSQPTAAMLLRSSRSGNVVRIDIPEHVAADSRLVECQLDVACGDAVEAFHTGPDRVGHIVVFERTAQRAEALAARYAEDIILDVA